VHQVSDSGRICAYLSFEIHFSAFDPFIAHWASLYKDGKRDEKLYDPYIGIADLRTDLNALHSLFEWKNGGKVSKQKLATIWANYFNCWTDNADLESRYLDPSKGGGAIWNIFYLHCRLPQLYPIYDQHTHRAMVYIRERVICEADIGNKPRRLIYESYTQVYRPFVEAIGLNLRKTDRALYTFGQFLKLAKRYTLRQSSAGS
jgi:hypothetical protein